MGYIQENEKNQKNQEANKHWEREKGLMLNTGKSLSLIDLPSTDPFVSVLSRFFFI